MTGPATPEASKNKASLAVLSGSKVLVLDLSSSEAAGQPRTFDPYPDFDNGIPISSLAWNHNQMVIATSSAIPTDDLKHDNIVLLSSQSGQTLDSFKHDADWKQQAQQKLEKNLGNCAAKSVGFGGKSRYLCIGDESGAVCLWDLKKKLRVRQFFHTFSDKPDPSLQVSLDSTDTYVLSLSPSNLYQYNLRDGQLVGRLGLPPQQDGNELDLPHFTFFSISDKEPHLVAIGADDGRIFVHDIGSDAPLLEMPQHHSGAVTGLAFFAKHPDLLLSCGSDGNILVHNKAQHTSYNLPLESYDSIVCMSLHANGSSLAVGCQSGDVFVYKINVGSEEPPMTSLISSFQANEPVSALSFAPPPRAKNKQKQAQKAKNTNTETKSVSTSKSETSKPKPTTTQTKTASAPAPKSSSPNKPRAASPFARKLASLTAINKKEKERAAARSKSPAMNRAPLSPRKFSPSPTSSPNKYSRIKGGKEQTPPKQNVSRTKKYSNQSLDSCFIIIFANYARANPFQIQYPSHHTSHACLFMILLAINQTEQIREVVREEVENLQDEMEEQLRNLHIDMINQFHQQSQEMQSIMAKHFEALERLTAENQQLREENEQLRRGIRG